MPFVNPVKFVMYSYLKLENVVAYLCNRQIYCGQTLNLEYVNISKIYNIYVIQNVKKKKKKNNIPIRRQG